MTELLRIHPRIRYKKFAYKKQLIEITKLQEDVPTIDYSPCREELKARIDKEKQERRKKPKISNIVNQINIELNELERYGNFGEKKEEKKINQEPFNYEEFNKKIEIDPLKIPYIMKDILKVTGRWH